MGCSLLFALLHPLAEMSALQHFALTYYMCTQEGMRGAQNWRQPCLATDNQGSIACE